MKWYYQSVGHDMLESERGEWVKAEEAEAKLRVAIEALEQYATKSNWDRGENGWLNTFNRDTNGPFIAFDALAKLKEEA